MNQLKRIEMRYCFLTRLVNTTRYSATNGVKILVCLIDSSAVALLKRTQRRAAEGECG